MTNDRYLMHYGVKGMKWGVRHDPQRTGYSMYSTKLSEKQKKILKRVAIGPAITGGVLLASYGGVKANDLIIKYENSRHHRKIFWRKVRK